MRKLEREIWEKREKDKGTGDMTDGQVGAVVLILALLIIIRIMDKENGK